MPDIQSITDSLARRIQRPVNIDDPNMRLLTHSVHTGAIDDGRLESILRRRVPEKVVAWLRTLGIADAVGPLRVDANHELGTLARVCVPIRCQNRLLGYMWVIDVDASLTDDDLALARSAADAVGNILYREQLLSQLRQSRERELLRDLLSEQPDIRRYAADELIRSDIFADTSPFFALVVRPLMRNGNALDDDVQCSLGETLDEMRWSRPPRTCLHLVRADHGVLVVAAADAKRADDEVVALGHRLHTMVDARLAETESAGVVIGIGRGQPMLGDILRSYTQAQRATRVAEIAPSLGPVAAWWQLGIYQMLSQLPLENLDADTLPPGLVRLLEDPDHAHLVETLERFLDNAGDIKSTAADLTLHRATLYYRLQLIEEIAQVDLRRGEDRLALHLGLKFARLVHLYPFAIPQQTNKTRHVQPRDGL